MIVIVDSQYSKLKYYTLTEVIVFSLINHRTPYLISKDERNLHLCCSTVNL